MTTNEFRALEALFKCFKARDPEFAARIDDSFFTRLETAWRVDLNNEDRAVIALFLSDAGKKREPGCSGPEYHQKLKTISRLAGELALAIQELNCKTLPGTYGRIAANIYVWLRNIEAGTAEAVAEYRSKENRGSEGKSGRELVSALAYAYRHAGGYVSKSYAADGQTMGGLFAAGLRVVWEILPQEIRPPTAETFARLAKKLECDECGAWVEKRGTARLPEPDKESAELVDPEPSFDGPGPLISFGPGCFPPRWWPSNWGQHIGIEDQEFLALPGCGRLDHSRSRRDGIAWRDTRCESKAANMRAGQRRR